MSKELENDFFYRLRLITTLLIKQASPEYRELMPLVKEYEDGHWDALDLNEKYQRLDTLLEAVAPGSPLANHFTEFPHEWTKGRFLQFIDALNLYCGALRHQLQ